jgi:hypothetical protein
MTDLAFRTRVESPLAEGVSPLLTAQLADETGARVPLAMITTLTLTLHDLLTSTIINTRDRIDVLNANGATVVETTVGGVEVTLLTWQGEPDDTLLTETERTDNPAVVSRVALIEYTWSAGTRAGRHQIIFEVWNLDLVPAPPV